LFAYESLTTSLPPIQGRAEQGKSFEKGTEEEDVPGVGSVSPSQRPPQVALAGSTARRKPAGLGSLT
jgi:hypothetical protein